MEIVRLADLVPTELVDGIGDCKIQIPTWAFRPDQWSRAFQRGLRQLPISRDEPFRGWEIGTGTGVNALMLGKWFPNAQFRLSDSDGRCTRLAFENLTRNGLDVSRFEPLDGNWDLIKSPKGQTPSGRTDLVVACIPQVTVPKDNEFLHKGDNLAHYYDPAQYPDIDLQWHAVGLGLNAALLKRGKKVLSINGRIVLNLAGRPSRERLLQMFVEHDYQPRILHEEVIAQDPNTELTTMAQQERDGDGLQFEFFTDQGGNLRINARTAERRRLEGKSLFHKIYVIEGRPL